MKSIKKFVETKPVKRNPNTLSPMGERELLTYLEAYIPGDKRIPELRKKYK